MVAFGLCALTGLGFGSESTAVRKVREGIRQFQAGKWESAGQNFTEADVAQPDNLRIAFDRACVYAATGDVDKAREILQRVALSRDAGLAVRAHYNLGCLAASQARAVFGEQPEEASPEQRAQGLESLTRAVGHYRDCLRMDDGHSEARHNLEIIRLWMKHMQAVWQERDRQRARQEMNLLEFLSRIEAQQTELRSRTRQLGQQAPSPKRRQLISETQKAQHTLADEVEPLKEKIQQELQPKQAPAAGVAANANPQAAPDDQATKAIEVLSRLADESGQAMRTASDEVAEGTFDGAVETQARALDSLNQIYMAVAPYTALLNRSLSTQQRLVDQLEAEQDVPTTAAANDDDADQQSADAENTDSEPTADEQTDPSAVGTAGFSENDIAEFGRQQLQVADWIQMLTLKAQQGQPQIEAQAKSLATQPPPTGAQSGAGDAQQRQEQLQALMESMKKAIELGPQAQRSAQEAGKHLMQQETEQAFPKQEQALKLLKEIREPLPKQDPSDQQQGDQNKQDQQDRQDEQQKQDASDQQKDRGQQKQPSPKQLSRQQAMSVLRRARERERKHRQAQKQLQRFLNSPIHVDRDW